MSPVVRRLAVVLVSAGVLLAIACGLGWVDPLAWIGRDAASTAAPPPLLDADGTAKEDAADPTLVGRSSAIDAEGEDGLVPPPVDLASVDRALDLHGTVVRADGTPVAGAALQVVSHPWRHRDLLTQDGYQVEVEGPSTRSAVDGTFALRLPRAALVVLRASAPGLAPAELQLLQAGERVRVVLRDAVVLEVVVRGPDEGPVAGTQIRLFGLGGRGRTVYGTTDAEGICRFDDLEPGRQVWLDVTPPRFGYPGWVEAVTPAQGKTTVEVDLGAGRTLRGRVTDAATGAPIAGARVGMNWTLEGEVATGADGRYELAGWTGKGIEDLHVLAEGHARGRVVVGDRDEIDVALQRGGVAAGRVVDLAGRAIAGARVSVVGSRHVGREQRISMAAARTEADGTFRLGGLSLDLPHTLIAFAPGYGRTLVDFDLRPDEAATDLGPITLPGALTIAGVLVDAGGTPAARADVSLRGGNDDPAGGRGGAVAQDGYGETLERATDDLGRFVFPDLAPGTYELRALQSGGPAVTRTLKLEQADLVDLRLALVATNEYSLRVEDEDGAPVSGAYVSVRAGRFPGRRTDAEGRATLRLPMGPKHRIQVDPYRREELLRSDDVLLPPDGGEVVVVLRRAETIRGRLVTESGEPIAKGFVAARRGDVHLASDVTDDDGVFVLKLERGPPVDLVFEGQTARAEGSAYQRYAGRVEQVVVGSRDVVLTASEPKADRALDVVVLDPEGRGVPDVAVYATDRHGIVGRGTTDARGRCRLEGIPGLSVLVHAGLRWSPERPWKAPDGVTVPPDGQEAVVRLEAARAFRVRIETGESLPPDVWIRVRVLRDDGSDVCDVGARPGSSLPITVDPSEDGPFIVVADTGDREPVLRGRLEGVRADGTEHVLELRRP